MPPFYGIAANPTPLAGSEVDRFERTLPNEPHVEGRHIYVRTIRDRVDGRGLEPRRGAERLDLVVADVYRAPAYYCDHPDEMDRIDADRTASLAETRAEAEANRPPGADPG